MRKKEIRWASIDAFWAKNRIALNRFQVALYRVREDWGICQAVWLKLIKR